MEKIEKKATKKDLTGVKKKVLKRRLDELITSKKEVIKRLQEDDQGIIEQTESRISSFVKTDKYYRNNRSVKRETYPKPPENNNFQESGIFEWFLNFFLHW